MHDPSYTGQIDRFALEGLLGRGGMAAVFLARTPDTDRRLALKALAGPRASEENRRRRFQREVRAMAQMDHPSIARVYDFGLIAEGDELPAELAISPGSPWMALEYAEGRPLPIDPAAWSWPALRRILGQILDALAHSHAHGIFHRDLKPANIIAVRGERPIDIKLVDFGLARVTDDRGEADRITRNPDRVLGTPNFMAPEQIDREFGEQGPWTDLYALGVLAWKLTTGEAPFEAETKVGTLRGHLVESLPTYRPTMPVPEGLERWLTRALRKSPGDRFQRAADALHELARLEEMPGSASAPEQFDGGSREATGETAPTEQLAPDAPTVRLGDDGPGPAIEETVLLDELDPDASLEEADPASDAPAPARPSVPADWRRPFRDGGDEAPTGNLIGERLFAVRRPPLVGREEIRDALWTGLRDAAETGRPRGIVLSGDEGHGKSRLAAWCCERAHETGAAHVWKAFHSRQPATGPHDGLGPMLARFFRCSEMTEAEILEELASREGRLAYAGPADPDRRLALARMMAMREPDHEQGDRHGSTARTGVLDLVDVLIDELVETRPLLVWLDDLQWDATAAWLAERMFERHGDDCPLFVVMTVDDLHRPDDPGLAERLAGLENRPAIEAIEVPPLSDEQLVELAHRGLGLVEPSARQVAAHTEGNPLFAIELIRHWAESDRLVRVPDGYALKDSAPSEMPDGLHRLWRWRLDRLFDDLGADARQPARDLLVLGAVLGRTVDDGEWRAAARHHPEHRYAFDRLIEVARRHGLVVPDEERWSFSHGLLRHFLVTHVADAAALERMHLACAEGLVDLHDSNSGEVCARIAGHFAEAGEAERALAHYRRAAVYYAEERRERRFREILRHRRQLFEGLPREKRDRHEARNRLLEARFLKLSNRMTDCAEKAREVREGADADWAYERSVALWCEAVGHRAEHAIDRSEQLYRRAVELIDAGEHPRDAIAEIIGLAGLLRDAGELIRAREMYARGIEIAEEHGATLRLADLLWNLSYTHQMEGHPERALEMLDEALALEGVDETHRTRGQLHLGLGEAYRDLGDFEQARAAYVQARELLTRVSKREVVVAESNLALIDVFAGETERARERLQSFRGRLRPVNLGKWRGAVDLGLAVCAAREGEWGRAGELFEEAVERIASWGVCSVDFALLAESLVEAAREGERPELARGAAELAAEQRRALEHDE